MRLPKLMSVADIVRVYGLSARQQLSQNFLLNLHQVDKIARKIGVAGATVVEVGSGPGSLTRSLLVGGARHVVAVEKDERFLPALHMLRDAVGEDRMTIVHGDMLKMDEAKLFRDAGADVTAWGDESKTRLVGNLPFGVASALLVKWMRQVQPRVGAFECGRTKLGLMFQLEVAERICAEPDTKAMGRLSVLVQHLCDAEIIEVVGRESFVPPPKVDAAVALITPKADQLDVPTSAMEHVSTAVFSMKRKMLRSGVKRLVGGSAALERAGIDARLRPAQLSVDEWVALTREYVNGGGK